MKPTALLNCVHLGPLTIKFPLVLIYLSRLKSHLINSVIMVNRNLLSLISRDMTAIPPQKYLCHWTLVIWTAHFSPDMQYLLPSRRHYWKYKWLLFCAKITRVIQGKEIWVKYNQILTLGYKIIAWIIFACFGVKRFKQAFPIISF